MINDLSTLDELSKIPSSLLQANTNIVDIHQVGSLPMQEFHEIIPFNDAFFEVEFPTPTYFNVQDEIPFVEESLVLPQTNHESNFHTIEINRQPIYDEYYDNYVDNSYEEGKVPLSQDHIIRHEDSLSHP